MPTKAQSVSFSVIVRYYNVELNQQMDQLKNTIRGAGTNDDIISCQGRMMTSFPIILKYSEMNLHVFSEEMVEEFVACEWQAKTVILRVKIC